MGQTVAEPECRRQSTDQGGLLTQKVFTGTVANDEEPAPMLLEPDIASDGTAVIRWISIANDLYTLHQPDTQEPALSGTSRHSKKGEASRVGTLFGCARVRPGQASEQRCIMERRGAQNAQK